MNVCSCRLLQGEDRQIPFRLTYTNTGNEEARNIQLLISDFPAAVFQQIILSPEVSVSHKMSSNFRYEAGPTGSEFTFMYLQGQEGIFDCPRTDDGSVQCFLQERFLSNQVLSDGVCVCVIASLLPGFRASL